MLYLTSNKTGHPRAYRVYIDDTMHGKIFVDKSPWASIVCIIDIDEQEACVLALQGHRLFKVELVESPITYYDHIAVVSDIDEVLAWRRTIVYA